MKRNPKQTPDSPCSPACNATLISLLTWPSYQIP
jgi:hypothetical protein